MDFPPDIFQLSLEELLEASVEVEVASLFKQNKLDVGSAVWSIDEQEWNRQNAKTIVDTIQHSPGVYPMDLFGTLVPSFRGFGHQETTRDSLFLFDGVPINSYSFQGSGQAFSLLDLGVLERVETIRGPGSSIYGASASHGVVSLIPWAPENSISQFKMEGGSWNYKRLLARTHQKLGHNSAVTFIASGNKNDDQDVPYQYTDSTTSEIVSDGLQKINKVSSFYGNAKYKKSAISILYNKWNRDGLTASFGRGTVENGGQYSSKADTTLIKASNRLDLPSEFYVDSFVSYQEQKYESFSPFIAGKPQNANPTNVILAKENHTSLNIIVKRPASHSLSTQIAFGYIGNQYHIDELSRFVSTDTTYTEGLSSGKDRTIHSGFFQTNTFLLDDTINILLGGRIDKYSDFGSHISPRAGLIFHPSGDSALKILYGHAFRAPSGLEQGGLANILAPGGNDLEPEELDSYEMSYLLNRKQLSLELTMFYAKMRDNVDVVVNDGVATEPFRYVNALEANSRGVEFDLKWSPTDYLRMEVSGSSIKVTSDDPGQYRAFPQKILHWGVNYFFLSKKASISLYNTHLADMQSSDGRDTKLANYWNTNLNAQYQLSNSFGSPRMSIGMNNLFHRDEVKSIASTTENGQPQTPFHVIVGIQFSI